MIDGMALFAQTLFDEAGHSFVVFYDQDPHSGSGAGLRAAAAPPALIRYQL